MRNLACALVVIASASAPAIAKLNVAPKPAVKASRSTLSRPRTMVTLRKREASLRGMVAKPSITRAIAWPPTNGFKIQTSSLTPGAIATTDLNVLRQPGYSKNERNVDQTTKNRIGREYGYTGSLSGVEIDHLVPIELGGANADSNLWAQPIAQARVKDKVETACKRAVFSGKMSLAHVQQAFRTDWRTLIPELKAL